MQPEITLSHNNEALSAPKQHSIEIYVDTVIPYIIVHPSTRTPPISHIILYPVCACYECRDTVKFLKRTCYVWHTCSPTYNEASSNSTGCSYTDTTLIEMIIMVYAN